VQVLSDVGLTVAPREFVSLIGSLGRGKTTLLRADLRLLPGASEDVPGPGLECRPALGQELAALVDRRHAADRALHVVQQPVGHVRRDAGAGRL
jgi:ABC-type nitrate/sulfonate/bicarbonate transport system ATPase subunit